MTRRDVFILLGFIGFFGLGYLWGMVSMTAKIKANNDMAQQILLRCEEIEKHNHSK